MFSKYILLFCHFSLLNINLAKSYIYFFTELYRILIFPFKKKRKSKKYSAVFYLYNIKNILLKTHFYYVIIAYCILIFFSLKLRLTFYRILLEFRKYFNIFNFVKLRKYLKTHFFMQILYTVYLF